MDLFLPRIYSFLLGLSVQSYNWVVPLSGIFIFLKLIFLCAFSLSFYDAPLRENDDTLVAFTPGDAHPKSPIYSNRLTGDKTGFVTG